MSWGSFHNFRILQTSAGGYHMYLDGAYMLSNSYGHGSLPTPQVTAETDYLCTRMWTLAERNPNPPVSTLYYATGSPSAPTWNLFVDSYLKSADAISSDNFVSESAGGQASFYGYGGG